MERYYGDFGSHVANLHYPYANMAQQILSKSTAVYTVCGINAIYRSCWALVGVVD